jgi:hypothetical protein
VQSAAGSIAPPAAKARIVKLGNGLFGCGEISIILQTF